MRKNRDHAIIFHRYAYMHGCLYFNLKDIISINNDDEKSNNQYTPCVVI